MVFNNIDTNKDGVLSLNELKEGYFIFIYNLLIWCISTVKSIEKYFNKFLFLKLFL